MDREYTLKPAVCWNTALDTATECHCHFPSMIRHCVLVKNKTLYISTKWGGKSRLSISVIRRMIHTTHIETIKGLKAVQVYTHSGSRHLLPLTRSILYRN